MAGNVRRDCWACLCTQYIETLESVQDGLAAEDVTPGAAQRAAMPAMAKDHETKANALAQIVEAWNAQALDTFLINTFLIDTLQ